MLELAPDPTSRARVRSDERRLLASVGISALGTWSYNVGIAVYAYQQTGSSAWVAAATVGRYVPALVITSLGSRWADRLPRRQVAITSDVVCALVMAALTVVATVHAPLVLAIALAAISSGVARLQNSAALASVADLVPESRLARAATAFSTVDAVATAAGPALAAVVLAVASPAVLFALNGVTFAVSAVLVATVTSLPRSAPALGGGTDAAYSDDSYRAAVRMVRPLLALRTAAAVVYGADVVLLAVIATQQLRQGTSGYGWLLAAAGAGGLMGAGWLRGRGPVELTARRGVGGMVLYGLPLLAFLAAPALGGSIAVQVVRGAGLVLVTVTVISGLQRAVPARASGRVFGLTHVLVLVGTSLGAILTPILLDQWGLDATVTTIALVPIVVAGLCAPALRRYDRQSASSIAALDPRVDRLRTLALFHDASRATLYAVADQVQVFEPPPGTPVVVQGDTSDALYVIVEGTVEVFLDREGTDVHVRTMSAPSYFGEIGLVHGVARTATVVAGEGCTLWRIPAQAFLFAAGQAGLSGALTEGVRLRLGTTSLLGA